MKKSLIPIAILITILSFESSTAKDPSHMVTASLGAVWPNSIIMSDGNKVVWNSSVEWGKIFDRRIILGAKADFNWKVVSKSREGQSLIYAKNRSFMLPLSGWIAIDPIPQYRFHPLIHAQVGYNSLFYSETNYDDKSGNELEKNVFKYFYGVYSKFGFDGVFDLGKEASIFIGYEYQIAPLYHKNGNTVESISVNGSGFRFGVNVLY